MYSHMHKVGHNIVSTAILTLVFHLETVILLDVLGIIKCQTGYGIRKVVPPLYST